MEDTLDRIEARIPGYQRRLANVLQPVQGAASCPPVGAENGNDASVRSLDADEVQEERAHAVRELGRLAWRSVCAHVRVLAVLWWNRSRSVMCAECGDQNRSLTPTSPLENLDIATDLDRYLAIKGIAAIGVKP